MYTYAKSLVAKIIIGVLCVLVVIVSSSLFNTKVAHAQGVPITTGIDFQSIMNYQKNFTLDKIATAIAKQILHKMTMSVVNWINSGFNGSPSFLTNPGGFFLDAADQLTGEFITTGPLKGLCSPFGLNVRLAIAGGQTGYNGWERPYTCTLGTIINNVQNNGANIHVGVVQTRNGATLNDIMNGNVLNNSQQLSINGQSANQFGQTAQTASDAMNEFMSGDFSKGGFPALYSMILEPQNNVYGAYLYGRSDLRSKIAAQEQSINRDIDRGGGFLTWKDCKDVSSQTTENPDSYAGAQNLTEKTNSDGSYSQQLCETATPGSVIASSINKSAGVGQDELVAANDINAVVNALISQLMSTMLSGGLHGMSSGGNSSYVSRASGYDSNPYIMGSQSLSGSVDILQTNIDTYGQAVTLLTTTRDNYNSVRSCFTGVLDSSRRGSDKNVASYYISNIDSALSTYIEPMLTTLKNRQSAAASSLAQAQNMTSSTAIDYGQIVTSSAESAQKMIDQKDAYIQNTQGIVSGGLDESTTAEQDLTSAKNQANTSAPTISDYQNKCNALINGTYSSYYGGFYNN